MLRKYVPVSRTNISRNFQLYFLVQASFHGLYVIAPKRFGLQKSHYCLGVESAGFPGQREEEIDRLLHMVRTVSRSQEQAANKTRLSLAVGQLVLKSGWVINCLGQSDSNFLSVGSCMTSWRSAV